MSVLYRNSVGHHAPTALVSTHDTSEPKDSGVSDKDPVLAQHAEQEAFASTENVLPVHGILVRNPTVLLEKSHAGELSLSGEAECLSLQSDGSTHVQHVQEEGFPSAHAFLSSGYRRPPCEDIRRHPERIFGDLRWLSSGVCVVKGRSAFFDRESPVENVVVGAGMLIGRSEAMREIATVVRQVAAYPSTTVLLQGESGTGKDVVARTIHTLSRRATYQFVDINCAAIPDTLLETELFGVEAGAFTDAKASRTGHVLRADGGTLFLDEIGLMSPFLQPKLLRFLETRSFLRVGGTKEIHVDLRVISATNVDLHAAVARGTFREDLFYRLAVVTLHLPPLRDRPEDIEPLVEHFLRVHTPEGLETFRVSQETMELLQRYHWPGNVRELRSVIQRGQILCDAQVILPKDLPEEIRSGESNAARRLQELQQQLSLPPEGVDLRAFLDDIELTFVREALQHCNGNQVRAAALLGISRDQLRYRLTN